MGRYAHLSRLDLSMAKDLGDESPHERLTLICGPSKPVLLDPMSHGKNCATVLGSI